MIPFLDKILFKLEKGMIGDSIDCWSQLNTRTFNGTERELYCLTWPGFRTQSPNGDSVFVCLFGFKFPCGSSRGQPRLDTGNPNYVIPT